MRQIYVTQFGYDRPNLARVEVEKETMKLFFVARATNLLGSLYIPKRLAKTSRQYTIFDTEAEAMNFLLAQCNSYISGTEKRLVALNDWREKLEKWTAQ